jgi:heme-degrading monooxygenase HmoA
MPSLPWTTCDGADPGASAVVMASRFRVRRYRDVPRFLIDSVRIRRQVRSAPGALGVSLTAQLLRREFLTLSAWSDHTAVRNLVRAEPHASAMQRHRSVTSESTFVFFDVTTAQLPPHLDDARHRLDKQRAGLSD